jgi:hypothetical protein
MEVLICIESELRIGKCARENHAGEKICAQDGGSKRRKKKPE